MALGAVATVLGLAACGSTAPQESSKPTQTEKVSPAAVSKPAKVSQIPGDTAQNVSPADPVRVTVADGALTDVHLVNDQGREVTGLLSTDKHNWTATESLGYDRTYTWSGSAVGSDGKQVPLGGSFHTLRPARQISAQINVGDNDTVGVGEPIVLTFSSPVQDKAAVERALTVQTSNPTTGSWAWLDDKTVHYRTKDYWPANTKVTLLAKLYGTSFGGGAFGAEDMSTSFTVGRSLILRGNTQTHRLQVFQDGNQIADYPASYGLDSDPGRVTNSGTHIVMSKSATFAMTNPKYHYENVVVPWAVRISNNGEFVHGYAPSIWAQGNTNVSHGCANLSPANAQVVYNEVLPGDPVEITGSTQQLGAKDGDYYDWTVPWDQWLAKSALHG
ncbi:L,D-transpeptidase [Kutzneria kofuensis]|uniref:Lipoprotein-anchoring transpeptidase ErfK/SrfK n=1 Tax=Kutzneria kofuensis TaxID=103725 RepID=A0A7W9KIP7_9PSEU|nr:Ig-like domain-containing protein [Kutzneria kofuensis]MBB5893013.1 lipoprotein-anchoring transpeptidase ErfK/SrfK [Kutzneria kofuensis]